MQGRETVLRMRRGQPMKSMRMAGKTMSEVGGAMAHLHGEMRFMGSNRSPGRSFGYGSNRENTCPRCAIDRDQPGRGDYRGQMG